MGIGLGTSAAALLGACTRQTVAPAFRYTLLDGSRQDSAGLRGKPVLLQFWATTCAICMSEMPDWVALHEALAPRGLKTLAVAVQADPPARVSMVAESRRLPFDVVIDNTGEIAQAFGDVRATPTGFLIDKLGRIDRRWVGAADFAALHGRIATLLAAA